jgi:O-antigen/teichoic acid export membrane protein
MTSFLLIGYKIAADVAAKAVMFVLTVLAARRLTQDAFGAFGLASTLGWMLAVIADSGVQLHVARELARRPAHAAATVRRWLGVRLALTFAAVAVVTIAATLGAFGDQAFAHVVIVIAYLLGGLVEFFHYVYRGLSRSDLESSLILTQRALTLAAGGAVLVWMPRLDLFALALLLPAMLTLGLSRGLSMQVTQETAAAAGDVAPPRVWDHDSRAEVPLRREFVRDVLPIGAGIVLSAIYFRVDVFLIQLWSGPERVALYTTVLRLVDALRLFPAAVLAVALPQLCRARDTQPLRQLATRITALAVLVTLPLIAAAPWVVTTVYGARYAEAGPAFRVLLLSFPLLSLNYALTHQIVAWNAHRAYAALCAVALATNVLLNVLLIPAQGIVGAAWATLATELVVTAGCAIGLARARQPEAVAGVVVLEN